jgi:hypothetical protein
MFDVEVHGLPRPPEQPASRPSAATAKQLGDQQEYQRAANGIDDQGTAAATPKGAELREQATGKQSIKCFDENALNRDVNCHTLLSGRAPE